MDNTKVMQKVDAPDRRFWHEHFAAFPHFRNYVDYAFTSLVPEIWADDAATPLAAAFYTKPAWFLTGEPEAVDAAGFLTSVGDGSWILSGNPGWTARLEAVFGDRLETYPRQAFSPARLDVGRLRLLAGRLPEGLLLKQAGPDELVSGDTLLHGSVIDEFFTRDDFAQNGLAFCILHQDRMVAFAASNYPVRASVLEVFVRVADEPAYRRKGLATAVSAALLAHCLERGIVPDWDAANEASTALALKLGYVKTEAWAMYHIRGRG